MDFFYGLTATDKLDLKGGMELIGKLGVNDSTKIGIIPSASKDASMKF